MEKRKNCKQNCFRPLMISFMIRIGILVKLQKVGDSLVVTIPSRAKVEMVRKQIAYLALGLLIQLHGEK